MFIKKLLKPKKDSSTTVIRNFGFANTTSSGQGGITDFSNIDSKNINTINFSAVNAEISNLTNQNFTNTNSAIFEGELIGRGTVDLEDATVKLGSNNTFDELTGSDESKLYSNDITCDYLTVNKKAHFFELVIDKIKTVGGTVIFTPADGFTIDKVTETEDNYILFWRACTEVAEGEIGDTISETGQTMTEPVSVNMWQEWDQALCQSFNLGNESDYYFDVSNRYWWRVVEAASDDPEIQEINGVKYYCHWIMVYKNGTSSTTGKPLVDTGSDVPAVGDAVSMLGYRYDELVNPTQDDVNRASAIIIAAYNTPDNQITAPSYAQYQGIIDFNLSTYRKTYFDATRGKIFGEFVVDAGGGNTVDLDDYIKSFNNANPLEGFISTNNNQIVDLVVLQTDNSDKIYDLNNFPNNLQVMVNYEGTPQMDISDYDALTLTLFGVSYDLLEANNYTPNLPSGYQGIYVSNIIISQYQPFRLTLAFTGSEQVITTSSMILHAEITNSGTTYQLNKNIPINGVSSIEGVDAEFYGLNTVLESVQVDATQTLQPELIYNLKYISGTNVTYPVPSTQSLRVTTYLNNGTSSTIPVQWDNANNYWRFYPNATTDYYSSGNPVPVYYKVELVDNNIVVDGKVVDVQLSPMATFSVGADLTTLIYAETTRVENESNNKYTLLRADLNGLTTTVSNTVNDLDGVHTSLSQIDQKADRIELSVTSVATDLDTLETGLQTTGIDITNGEITLDATKTTVTGNFNIGGNFESYNAQYMNRTIINTNASQMQGLVMRGPNSIDTSTGLPTPGATETDLIRLDFQASAGPQSGQMTLYSRNSVNNYMQINSQEILLNNSNGSIDIDLGGINYSSLGTQYDRTWEELFCNKLRTNYIDTGTGYTVVDSDMITDIFLVVVSGDFGFYLPYPGPAWDGKRFYIKKINNSGDLRLVTTDRNGNEASYLLDGNDSSPQSSHWYDRYSVTVICAGNYWIVFRGDD